MTRTECQYLVESYISWLREGLSVDAVNGACELTTPFLDHHNDHLQIYAEPKGERIVLSDDGYILADLESVGMEFNTEKRKQVLTTILNGFGVHLDKKHRLSVDATKDSVGKKLHSLLQAMIAVNDTFVLAQPRIASFFWEDVREYLEEHDVRFSPRVKLAGKSGYDHAIDFLIPASRQYPERLVQAINNPSKNTIGNYLFALSDTVDARSEGSKAIAILNDYESKVNGDVIEALEAYSVTPAIWSSRSDYLELLRN